MTLRMVCVPGLTPGPTMTLTGPRGQGAQPRWEQDHPQTTLWGLAEVFSSIVQNFLCACDLRCSVFLYNLGDVNSVDDVPQITACNGWL